MLCNLTNGLWLFSFYWLFHRTNELWRAPCHSTFGSPSRKYHECSKSFSLFVFPVFLTLYPSSSPFFLCTFPSILYSLLFFPFNYSSKTFPDVFKSGRVDGFYSIDQILTNVLCVFIGWLCRQCRGLQTVFTSFSGWHEGQQAWHELAPFCGTSKWDWTWCTVVFSRFNNTFL